MKFKLRSIDAILKAWSAGPEAGRSLPDNVTFAAHGAFEPDIRASSFLNLTGANFRAYTRLSSEAEKARGLAVGVLQFSDVHLLPPAGLILDFRNNIAWQGALICWSDTFSNRFLGVHAGLDQAAGTIQCAVPDFETAPAVDTCVLISGGGYAVYGHWIIDFLPRFHIAALAGHADLPHYCRPARPWAQKFADVAAPGCFSLPAAYESQLLRVGKLIVPTSVRKHGVIADRIAVESWTGFEQKLEPRAPPVTGAGARKLFVSRAKWARKRNDVNQIVNINEVERRFNRAGFVSVHPETLSFAQQRDVFADAEIVAGEDGSGLHNIIFSKPGIKLCVLTSNRLNTMHAVIANARQQVITYAGSARPNEPAPPADGHRIPPHVVNAVIEELNAGAPAA